MTADRHDEVWSRLVAATAVVVARQGYADTRIGDIAREAGVPVGELFGRFRSKNDLLRQALVHTAAAGALGWEDALDHQTLRGS